MQHAARVRCCSLHDLCLSNLTLWYVASSKTFCMCTSALSLYTVWQAPLLPSQLRACITSLLLWLQ